MKKIKIYIIATKNGDARKEFIDKKAAKEYYATLDSTEFELYCEKR